jgi:hypothetical protein
MDVSGKLKILMGDLAGTEYADTVLYPAIKTACGMLEGKYYQKFVTTDGISITPSPSETQESIIALQAAIILTEHDRAKSVRNTINYRDAAMSINTNEKTDNHTSRTMTLKTDLASLIKIEHDKKITPTRGVFDDRDGNTSTSAATFTSTNEVVPPKV